MSEQVMVSPGYRSNHARWPTQALLRHAGLAAMAVLAIRMFAGAATCGGTPVPRRQLDGFVDLHTHPVANVGFGGTLVYGAAGPGTLLPDCNAGVRATTEESALGRDHAIHGGWNPFDNPCGDSIREPLMHVIQLALHAADPPGNASGFPTFTDWPVWNDMTHQKMWVEWIRRSFNGGLRVMVALAVNNKTLGDLISHGSNIPTSDKASADLQIDEIKRLVAGSDFMEIARTADDLARINAIPKLAVVIGVEIDHIGDLQAASWSGAGPTVTVPTLHDLKAEIHRLYNEDVRYIFPIHLVDNAFGGTAAYDDLFDLSNLHESGAAWQLRCADPGDGITYQSAPAIASALGAQIIASLGLPSVPGVRPACAAGQRNSLGLSANGIEGLREMMRLGMLIDVDHMSQTAVDQALGIAEAVTPGGYPLNSGHNNVRGPGNPVTERAFTALQYQRIGALHGIAGIGSSGQDAAAWLRLYQDVMTAMGPGAVGGFGTDTNGFGLGMPPRPGSHVTPTAPNHDGAKTWDYNRDGVAHYGMLPEFLQDVGSLPGGAAVVANAMTGAEYFYQTWHKAELQRTLVTP